MKTTSALLVLLAVALAPAGQAQATCTIPAGFDLFETDAVGTQIGPDGFPLMHFGGVPIGSYDFGSGLVTLTTTDTIVKRDAVSSNPVGVSVAPVEVVGLQLQAVEDPTLFVTLQSQRPLNGLDPPVGPPSLGTLLVRFDPDCTAGDFESAINVNFDLRTGAVGGPIVATGHFVLTTRGTPWQAEAEELSFCMDHPEATSAENISILASHKICGPSDVVEGVNDGGFYPGYPSSDDTDPSFPGVPGRGGFMQGSGTSGAPALGAFGLLTAFVLSARRRGQP